DRDRGDPDRGPARDGRGHRPFRSLRLRPHRTALAAPARDRAALRRRGALAPQVVRRVPATALVIGAAFSVQGGAAVAKSLFPELGPPGVVFLRLLFGTITLLAIQRPRLGTREHGSLRLAAALGIALVCMNLSFYEALQRVPLGIAVTIE